jgi:imidazolonepropionase-like amidohydrolase
MLASWFFVLLSTGAPGVPAAPAPAQDESLWIRAERVIVRPGVELADAAILVERGVIVAIGPEVEAPEGARRIEGAVACAGFVDPWSSLGLDGGSVDDLGTKPATRTVDAVDPWRRAFEREEANRGGVTSVRAQAGRAAPVGGIGAVLRVEREGESDVVLEDACVAATIGISRGGKRGDVFDRAAEVERLIAAIDKGRRYREAELEYRDELAEWQEAIAEKREELEGDFKKAKKKREKEIEEAEEKGKEFKEDKYKEDKKPRKPKHDADDEVMARVAEGELPLVVEAHGAAEIRNLLMGTEKFDRLRLILAGATEAHHLADELAERGVPVIVWPVPMGADKAPEYGDHDLARAGELERAGVEVLIGSGGGSDARELRLLAALAVGHGLDPEAALGAITSRPAGAFDVRGRLGSLERGRDADVLVLDGDPLDTTARLRFVVSKGRVVVE